MTRTRTAADRLTDRTEHLLRQICPDLAGRPFYVILASRIFGGIENAGTVEGVACPTMSSSFRDVIGARWRGPGPAVIVDDRALIRPIRCLPLRQSIRIIRAQVLDVAIHELAHVAEWGWWEDQPPTEAKSSRYRSAVCEILTEPEAHRPAYATPPFHHHEWQWIRLATHLCQRARTLGQNTFEEFVIVPEHYGLSPAEAYVEAIGDEPTRFAGMPLADIKAEPPPQAFADLWNADVARWLTTQEDNRITPEAAQCWAAAARCNTRPTSNRAERLTMSTVLDTIQAAEEAAREKARAEWPEFVRRVIANKATQSEITKYLERSGRTVEDLKRTVAQFNGHRERVMLASREEEIAEERREIAERIAAEDAKVAEARRAALEVIRPLNARLLETEQELVKCVIAKSNLMIALPDSLKAKVSSLGARMFEGKRKIRELDKLRDRLIATIQMHAHEAAETLSRLQREASTELAEQARKKLAEAEAQIAAVNEEVIAIAEEQNRVIYEDMPIG